MTENQAVVVNFAALTAMVLRLQNIKTSFAEMSVHPAIGGTIFGAPALLAEYERFIDGWSQGRVRVEGELGAITQDVAHAVATYEKADSEIALDESGTAGPRNG